MALLGARGDEDGGARSTGRNTIPFAFMTRKLESHFDFFTIDEAPSLQSVRREPRADHQECLQWIALLRPTLSLNGIPHVMTVPT